MIVAGLICVFLAAISLVGMVRFIGKISEDSLYAIASLLFFVSFVVTGIIAYYCLS